MKDVIIYRCPICGKEYHAVKASFGICPKQTNCHECEGVATVIGSVDYDPEEAYEYALVYGREWNNKVKYINSERKYYRRFRFSDWEIGRLFEYEERAIEKGMLIFIRK